MENENRDLKIILEKLTKLRDELININEKSGATKRVQQMREEILKIGWQGVMKKYHPDVNTSESAANELFSMYKFVYEDMKKKIVEI
jgi:DnaJ-class molecular chaperone